MPPRVKLDEDLSPMVAEPLVVSGCDVATVHGQGWSGIQDRDLWPRVVTERRLFITADKGFADIRMYPPGDHAGLVVLRADRESIQDYRALIETCNLEELAGCLVVVSSRSVRIRRPPGK